MEILLYSIILAYTGLVIVLWLGWERIPILLCEEQPTNLLSVVVAVRNEEENILSLLTSLEKQSYKNSLFETIIVNDHSTDNTVALINEFTVTSELNLCVIEMIDKEGKKAAMMEGIEKSTGDFIITTDGDCVVQPDWLTIMSYQLTNHQTKMVCGPVIFSKTGTFWHQMMSMEFISVIGSSAATLGWQVPTMCNGANLAFAKSIFTVQGTTKQNRLASGDDVFLMHKINQSRNGSVVFCKQIEACVTTNPPQTVSSFYQQRIRWSGKWTQYTYWPATVLAVFIFISNLSLLAIFILGILNIVPLISLFYSVIIKFSFDYFFLRHLHSFFKKKIILPVFFVLSILYPIYVVIIALSSLFNHHYSWKGRKTQ